MKITRRKKWILLALGVVLLPFLYLLAAGPFAYFQKRGAISENALEAAAFPIIFAEEHGVFRILGVQDMLEEYYQWWMDQAEAANNRAIMKQTTGATNTPASSNSQ